MRSQHAARRRAPATNRQRRRPTLPRTNPNPRLCRIRHRNRTRLLTLCGAARRAGSVRVEAMNDVANARMSGERKERRGFASMTPEKQREIASKGGRAAHQKGTAHEWTSEEARSAGRKGGQISRGGRGRLVDDEAPETRGGRSSNTSSATTAFDAAVGPLPEACAYGETRSDMLAVTLATATMAAAQNSTTGRQPITQSGTTAAPSTAGSQQPGSSTQPATSGRQRHASRDDDDQRGYGLVVRADRRGVAGEEVVDQRVSRELRSRSGLHRRVGLAGDVRRSAPAIARRFSARGRWCAGSTATCGRCSSRPSRSPAGW